MVLDVSVRPKSEFTGLENQVGRALGPEGRADYLLGRNVICVGFPAVAEALVSLHEEFFLFLSPGHGTPLLSYHDELPKHREIAL